MPHQIWRTLKGDKEKSRAMSSRLAIAGYTAHLLTVRGVTTDEEAAEMIEPERGKSCPPELFADMDKAVSRISAALDSGEKIAVYGDYDVDGVTASALIYSCLTMLDADVTAFIPDREADGYGLSIAAVERIARLGVTLIVTVDNGISAHKEIEYAKTLGIDVVVTDHHEPSETLPNAAAVVDPHRRDCPSTFKQYAGVGVAYKLACALLEDEEAVAENFSDLVALGTVADLVPLRGENRALVKRGLESINRRERPGIAALAAEARLGSREILSVDLAYIFSPRINASGRLGSAMRAFDLLVSEDIDECRELAGVLSAENDRRHVMERELFGEVQRSFSVRPELLHDRVIVVDGEGWNRGVIGIFAAKLCERYGKPAMVISLGENDARGSCRSIKGFNLFECLSACSDLLTIYGGHECAAGMTLTTGSTEAFRGAVNEYAALLEDMPVPVLELDCELSPKHISLELVSATAALEPFGEGNRQPLVGLMGCTIAKITHLKDGLHQKLTLTRDNGTIEVLLFGVKNEELCFEVGDFVDAAVRLSRSEFNSRVSVSAICSAIKLSASDRPGTIRGERLFDRMMRGESLSAQELSLLCPTRAQLEKLYRFLRSRNGFTGDTEVLLFRLNDPSMSYAALLCALEVLAEAELIEKKSAAQTRIALLPVSGKTDLERSKLYCKLRDLCGGNE